MFHSQCFQLRVLTVFILALVSETRLPMKSKEALELPSSVPVVTTLLSTPWSVICSCLCCHSLYSLERSWLNRIVSGRMSTISLRALFQLAGPAWALVPETGSIRLETSHTTTQPRITADVGGNSSAMSGYADSTRPDALSRPPYDPAAVNLMIFSITQESTSRSKNGIPDHRRIHM